MLMRTLSLSSVMATEPVTTAWTRSSSATRGNGNVVSAYRTTAVRDATRKPVAPDSCVMISSCSWRANRSSPWAKFASGRTATAVMGALGS